MDPRERDAKHIKEKERQELLNRAYQRVVGSKLEQLSKKKVTTDQDEEDYRQSLALEREAATSKKRKSISAQHAQLARETGLSGQVVALMAGRDDSDDEDDSDSERSKKRKKKKKKRKKDRRKRHRSSSRDSYDDSSSEDSLRRERRERKSTRRKENRSRRRKRDAKKRRKRSKSQSYDSGDS